MIHHVSNLWSYNNYILNFCKMMCTCANVCMKRGCSWVVYVECVSLINNIV